MFKHKHVRCVRKLRQVVCIACNFTSVSVLNDVAGLCLPDRVLGHSQRGYSVGRVVYTYLAEHRRQGLPFRFRAAKNTGRYVRRPIKLRPPLRLLYIDPTRSPFLDAQEAAARSAYARSKPG